MVLSTVLPASSVFTSTSKFQVRVSHNKTRQLHRWQLQRTIPRLSPTCLMRISNTQFGEPGKLKLQISIGAKRLWQAAPENVREFPWRKAGTMILKRLMFIGQTTLKWSLVTLFIFSSISDVISSISRNQELMIPIGLLIGCLMTDFLNETLQEIFVLTEDKGLNMALVVTSGFFVLVKVVSTYFAARTQVLLLHVANGGLLQVLWLWRNHLTDNDKNNEKDEFVSDQDASLAADAEE